MSDFSNLTSKFRVHKNGPQDSLGKNNTRPRESLVCNTCRRSKLRCDRGQPCSSCLKRDEACSYQRSTVSYNHEVAEGRLSHLEATVKQLIQQNQAQASSQTVSNTEPRDPAIPLELLPHDLSLPVNQQPRNERGEKDRYFGSTHWSAMLDDIQELKVILGSSVDAQGTGGIVPLEVSDSNTELIFGSFKDYDIKQIISQHLPPKVEVDRLISTFFRGETFIVPFVHAFYFQRQYQRFWTETDTVNPLWLSILFSICCLGTLVREATGLSDLSSKNNLVIGSSALHVASGQCLVLGEYHRPQQYVVEALAMYAQCKSFNSLDPSREAGAILSMAIRLAYEMGYHRDPDSFGSFTAFEAEMRRRSWAICRQFDLMISFQLGLPSNICLENCDTKSPRNLLDSDFDADTQALPASRSDIEPTRLLWFIVKDRLMTTFSKVWKDALSFKEKPEAEIHKLDEEIRQVYRTIPEALRARPPSESLADEPFLVLTRIYVEFIYLKSICALHRRYMARGNAFSTQSCVGAGKRLVTQFIDMYKELAPGGQLYMERWMLTNFTMNDFLLGIMVLCLAVHTHWKGGSQNLFIDATAEGEALALLEQAYAICLEKSKVSRDALRVSHAIRLTLNGTKHWNTPNATRFPSMSLAPSPGMQYVVSEEEGANLASTLLHPYGGSALGDEAAFGALDPFNFLGSEFDNIDWSAFDISKAT